MLVNKEDSITSMYNTQFQPKEKLIEKQNLLSNLKFKMFGNNYFPN